MATRGSLIALSVLTAILATCSSSHLRNPPGCDVPSNLSTMNISQFVGILYLQAFVNFNTPTPTSRCNKLESFATEAGDRGITTLMYLDSTTNNWQVDVFRSKFIRDGVITFTSLRDPTLVLWDYFMTTLANGWLILHHCYVRNGTTVGQDFAYASRNNRVVPRQKVLNDFRTVGISVNNSYFVQQTNCTNN